MSQERPPRSLRGRSWFLNGVNDVFRAIDLLEMHKRNIIPVLKSLAALEVSRLLGVSRTSSKESKRTFLVPEWSQ